MYIYIALVVLLLGTAISPGQPAGVGASRRPPGPSGHVKIWLE